MTLGLAEGAARSAWRDVARRRGAGRLLRLAACLRGWAGSANGIRPTPELQLTLRSSAVWHSGVVVLLADGAVALDAPRRDTGAAALAAGLASDPWWMLT